MHKIKKLSVQINGSISNELQQRIHDILHDVIDKNFTRYNIGNKDVLIDKIHFDLGTIKSKYFEEEFNIRLSYLLQTELEKFFTQPDINVRLEEKIIFSEVDAFITYLQQGYARLDDLSLDTLFQHLLKTNISLLRQVVGQAMRSESMFTRLFYQVKYENLEKYWEEIFPENYRKIKLINERILTDSGQSASENKGLESLSGVLRKLTFEFMMAEVSHANLSYAFIELLKEHVDEFKAHEHSFKLSAFHYLDDLTKRIVNIPGTDIQKLSSPLINSIYIIEFILTGKVPRNESVNVILDESSKLKEEELKQILVQLINNKLNQSQFERLSRVFHTSQFEKFITVLAQNGKGNLASKAGEIQYLKVVIKQLFNENIYLINADKIKKYIFTSSSSINLLIELVSSYIKYIFAKNQQLREIEIIQLIAERVDKSHHKHSITLNNAINKLGKEIRLSCMHEDHITKDPMTAFMHFLKSGVWVLEKVTPNEILLKLLEEAPIHLRMGLLRILNNQTVWLRLTYQFPIDIIRTVFKLVFKEDDHFNILQNKLSTLDSAEFKELLYRKFFEAFIIAKILLKEDKEISFAALFDKTIADLSTENNFLKEITDFNSQETVDQQLKYYLHTHQVDIKINADQADLIVSLVTKQPHYLTAYILDQNISAARWKLFFNALKKENLLELLKIILDQKTYNKRWVISIARAVSIGFLNELFNKGQLIDLVVLIIKEDENIESFIADFIKHKKKRKVALAEKSLIYFPFIEVSSLYSIDIQNVSIGKNEFAKAVNELEIYFKRFKNNHIPLSSKDYHNIILAVLPFSQSASDLIDRFINRLLNLYLQYEENIKLLLKPLEKEQRLNFPLLVQEIIGSKSYSIDPYFKSFEAFGTYFEQHLQLSDELWVIFKRSDPNKLSSFLRRLNDEIIEHLISHVNNKYSFTAFKETYHQIVISNEDLKKEVQYFAIAYGLTHSQFNDFELKQFLENTVSNLHIPDNIEKVKEDPVLTSSISDFYIDAFLHYFKFDKHIYLPLEQDGVDKGLIKIITHRPDQFLYQLSVLSNISQISKKILLQIDPGQQVNFFTHLFSYDRSQVEFILSRIRKTYNVSREVILSSWIELILINDAVFSPEGIIQHLTHLFEARKEVKDSESKIAKITSGSSNELSNDLIKLDVIDVGLKSFTITKLFDEIGSTGKIPHWLNYEHFQGFTHFFITVVTQSSENVRQIFHEKFKSKKTVTNFYKIIGDTVFVESIKIIEIRLYSEMMKVSKILSSVHTSLGQIQALEEYFLINYVVEYYATAGASSEIIIANIIKEIPFHFGLSTTDYKGMLYKSKDKIIKDYLKNSTNRGEENSGLSYQLTLLLHLLDQNEVPWWAAEDSLVKGKTSHAKLVKTLIDDLLLKDPKLLVRSISGKSKSNKLYYPIFTILSNQQFDKLLLVINSDFGGFIISLNLLVLRSGLNYKKAEWFSFLFHITANMRSLNASYFIETSLLSIARLSGKEYKKVKVKLLAISKEAIKNGEMRFLPFIELLNTNDEEEAKQKELRTKYAITNISSISIENKNEQALRRIFKKLSDSQFHEVLLTLAPDIGDFIASFNALVTYSNVRFNKTKWLLSLLQIAYNSRNFNADQLVKTTLLNFARITGRDIIKQREHLLDTAEERVKDGEMHFLPFVGLLKRYVKVEEEIEDSDINEPKIKELEIKTEIQNDEFRDHVINIANQILETSYTTEVESLGIVDSVVHYIRTGSIPYNSRPVISNYINLIAFIERQFSFGYNDLRLAVIKALAEENTINRLIQNEKEKFLNLIAKILYSAEIHKLLFYKSSVILLLSKDWSVPHKMLNDIFYQSIFEHATDKNSSVNASTLTIAFVRKAEQLLKRQVGFTIEEIKDYSLDDTISSVLTQSEERYVEEKSEKKIKFDLPSIEPEEDLILDHRILINNAGLVITWPYLTRYFELLEMVENGNFKTENAAIRAVHLLQYISTGNTLAPEHELLLNKILCGVKVSTPVPRELILTEKEIKTSEMMLNGLIQNWKRLKSSSIDALREGFLIRDGYILEKEKTWELKVEKKTLDILMEDIPWSFGTIKLPWMDKRLNVEWI